MKKQLFFDDGRLFGRENVERRYGKPQLCSVYNDGICSTDFSTGYVFKLDDGSFRMLYFAHSKHFAGKKLFCAKSSDGINFEPEKLCLEGKKYEHEIMDLPEGSEIAAIYEDKLFTCGQRYKMLMSELDFERLTIFDKIYTSCDLLIWQLKKDAFWGNGTEPLTSVFYNSNFKCHTIIERPFWGIRAIGYKETSDWNRFSDYNYCLKADSCDEPLSEIYGMYAFSYDGMYIGFAHIYRGLKSELNAKYKNGIIDTQLAYSYDGRYWQRSLRTPFISGIEGDELEKRPLVWVASVVNKDDSVLVYASSSKREHGPAFSDPDASGDILVYKLRKDGFVCLSSKERDKQSVVATREKLWHGGELSVNIAAKNATVAVYESSENEDVEGMNVLGMSKPVEGFSHEDCLPFSGDSLSWQPSYKNGRMINELSGRVLVFEIRFSDGELYSLSGDYTDLFNTEGARYRKFGTVPEK